MTKVDTARGLVRSIVQRAGVAVPIAMRNSLVGGSALAVIGQGVKLSVGLLSIPLTIGYLGKERYGLWMVAASLLMFLGVIESSFVPALKNRLAESFGHRNQADFDRYASASLVTSALIAILILALTPIIIIVPWAALLQLKDASATRELVPLLLVLLAIGAAAFGTSFVEAIYAARMKISIPLACNLVVSLVGFALLLLAIHVRASLPLLAAITGSPISLARGFLFYRLSRRHPNMFRTRPRVAMRVVWALVPSSIAFGALTLTNVLLSSAPNIITARYLGIAEVTTLAVAQRLALVPLMMVAAIVPVFWPSFTIARAQGDHAGLKHRFALALEITAVALVAYSVALVIAGPATIRWWLGGRVTVTTHTFAMLGCWLVLQGVWYWLSTLLNSMGDVRIQVVCGCIQFGLLICCGIPLALHLGLYGLILAMTIATATGAIAPLGHRVRTKIQNAPGEVQTPLEIGPSPVSEMVAE